MSSPLNPTAIDYTGRDFASLLQSMLSQAGVSIPEWVGARVGDPNDYGVMLIELLAYEGDILSYYNDRVANEAYLSTATQRSSVLQHAAEIGYTPRTAVAASVDLTIFCTTSIKCTIPRGFQVATGSSSGITGAPLVFETQNDITFEPSTTNPLTAQSIDVVADEGVSVLDEIAGISTGALDQTFVLQQTPVIATSLIVRVVESPLDGGNVWYATNSLLNVAPADNAYAWTLDGNDALTLVFGDGINGRVPPRGSVIHVGYRVGGGSDGNVIAGTLTNIVDPTDVVFPQDDPNVPVRKLGLGSGIPAPLITCINRADAGGGDDSESLDSIRGNAPKALRSMDRAVTLQDYETLAVSIPTVHIAKAKAVGNTYTNITVYVASPLGSQVPQESLNAVVDYFASRKMVGATVVAATPQYVLVDIAVAVTVDNRYNQELVRISALNAVQSLLSFDQVNFGQRVSMGDVYTAALTHPGVTGVVVSKLVRSGGTTASDIPLRANEIPRAGSVTVSATGGVVNTQVYSMSNDGSGSPLATNAPTVTLLRCDPNSTHVELAWTGGSFITAVDVQIDFVKNGLVTSTTVFGPYVGTSAVFDLPLVGPGRADHVNFTVRAYNGVIGPVASPPTSNTYLCES